MTKLKFLIDTHYVYEQIHSEIVNEKKAFRMKIFLHYSIRHNDTDMKFLSNAQKCSHFKTLVS